MNNRYLQTMDSRRGVRGSGRGGDRAMDGHEKFTRFKGFLERQEDYARGDMASDMRRNDMASYPSKDYHYGMMPQNQYPMYHQDYARGGDNARGGDMRGSGDYDRGGDYGYDQRNDYGYDGHEKMSEEKYYKDLERWAEKLKKKDRFKMRKEDVLAQAKQMGVKFEEFSEIEFYVVYLMMISDYKNVANDHRMYLSMAKDWLEDDDIEVSPSEKLCIYYYDIVKGKGVE